MLKHQPQQTVHIILVTWYALIKEKPLGCIQPCEMYKVSFSMNVTLKTELTHLSQNNVPIPINLTSSFPFKGLLDGIFIIFIQILIEQSVSRQWRA